MSKFLSWKVSPISHINVSLRVVNIRNLVAYTSRLETKSFLVDPYTTISREACCTGIKPDPNDKNAPLCCLRVVIERSSVGGKSLRLLGFREPGDTQVGTGGGPIGPGLPLNVDSWPEKKSRSLKAQGLGINFNTELGNYDPFRRPGCRRSSD